MSAIIPGCDSDEEVFWGPVTAKELELIWRSRMANKKKGESANPVDKFVKNPGQNTCDQNTSDLESSNSVQEVPSLHVIDSGPAESIFHKSENIESIDLNSSQDLELNNDFVEHSEVLNDVNVAEDIDSKMNAAFNHSNVDNVPSEVLTNNCAEHSEVMDVADNNVPKINAVFNHLNIENVQLDVLNHDCAEHREVSNDGHDNVAEDIDSKMNAAFNHSNINNIQHEVLNKDCEECCEVLDVAENIGPNINPEFNHSNIESIQPEVLNNNCAEHSEVLNDNDFAENIGRKINAAFNLSNIENIPPEELNNDCGERNEVLNDVDVAENIGHLKKNNSSGPRPNGFNILQELQIENQEESINSNHDLKIDHVDKIDNGGSSESSDEKSYVSLNSEEDNSIPSSNSQYSSLNQDCSGTVVKNKENEEPLSVQSNQDCAKSKIPVSNHIQSNFLKPARLHHTPGTISEKWLSDLKRKKIPKPKKPEYMVSPAKLGSILKSRNQPMSSDKPALVDEKKYADPKTASFTPKQVPRSATKTLPTPKKKQFEYIKSPISEYIRSGTGIPTAKSLPALQSPNKIPVPINIKHTPVQKLPPKFYSSAEKLVIKQCSSSTLQPTENKTFLTPKVFKHQGRVADSKKSGSINVVTPRAVRKTNLTDTSFACLPQSSKGLEVSVLEEQ